MESLKKWGHLKVSPLSGKKMKIRKDRLTGIEKMIKIIMGSEKNRRYGREESETGEKPFPDFPGRENLEI